MNWGSPTYFTGQDARHGMASQPGVDEMRMHRGAGFTIPDKIRADIILKDQEGWEVEDIIETGYPSDVVSQVLMESKVEGRNPAGATPTMKFPQGKSVAGTETTRLPDSFADMMKENLAENQTNMRAIGNLMNPQPAPDPTRRDILNPNFNKYRQEY